MAMSLLIHGSSHPNSRNYAKYLTSEEVIEMFAPEQKTVDSVKEWLVDHGINPKRVTRSGNKGWLAFSAGIEEADALLHAEYYHFEHTPTSHVTPACNKYVVAALWIHAILLIVAVIMCQNIY